MKKEEGYAVVKTSSVLSGGGSIREQTRKEKTKKEQVISIHTGKVHMDTDRRC